MVRAVLLSLTLCACAGRAAVVVVAAEHRTQAEWAAHAQQSMNAHDYEHYAQRCESWMADHPNDREAALCVAEANNSLADLAASDDNQRDQAIKRSLQLLDKLRLDGASQPTTTADARADFLTAEALGIRVRHHPSSALSAIGDIHQHALVAYRTNKRMYSGAAIRLLGMLLVKAPPWPQGPGDPDEGLRLLDEAIREFPDRPEAYAHKAEALLDQSRIKEADFWLTQAQKRRQGDARAEKVVDEVADRMATHKRVKSY